MITGTGKTGMCQSCINTIITTGRIQTKATRDKISKKLKGHKVSKITRKKISKANSGENNGMFAKKVSKATRSKMSEAQTERYKDPKEREKTGKQSRKFWKNPELKKRSAESTLLLNNMATPSGFMSPSQRRSVGAQRIGFLVILPPTRVRFDVGA